MILRRTLHWLALALTLLLWSAASTAPGSAHAALIASDPADGVVLDDAPGQVVLTFNEPVSATSLRLIDTKGSSEVLEGATQGNDILVPIPAELSDGTHLLSWRVISGDGHPVAGTVLFSIGAPTGEIVAPSDPLVRPALWIARVALYLGLFLGAAGSFFLAWIGSTPGARRVVRGLVVAGLVASPFALGLQGLDVIGSGLGSFFDGDAWRAAWDTTYSRTIVVAVLALLAGLAATFAPPAAMRVLATIALGSIGMALALSGHASSAPPQSLSSAAVALHTVGVAFWAGSLLPLLLLVRSRKAQAEVALERFSAAIPYAIVPLIGAGLILVYVQLEHVSDLWTTAYGRVLGFKLLAVIGLFVLAAINRLRLTARARLFKPNGMKAMAGSITAEIALVFVVLGLVALWRYTPPPRSVFAVANTTIEARLANDRAAAEVRVAPGRVGPVSLTATVTDPAGQKLAAKEVTVRVANPEAGIEAIERDAVLGDDGAWRVSDLSLPVGGDWTLSLDVLITDFEETTLAGTIAVPRMTASQAFAEAAAGAGDPGDGHGHTHTDLSALAIDVTDPLQVVDAGPMPPAIAMTVASTADEGLDLRFDLRNFAYGLPGEAEVHMPGRGHVHLYVNGRYVDQPEGDTYHLAPMPDGAYEIDVALSALDHRSYVANGELIAARTAVRVAAGSPIVAPTHVFDVDLPAVLSADQARTERVRVGDTVAINWRSEVPQVLHLHGYDIESSLSPSSPITMLFNANIPGRFPVESHDANATAVFYLEVFP